VEGLNLQEGHHSTGEQRGVQRKKDCLTGNDNQKKQMKAPGTCSIRGLQRIMTLRGEGGTTPLISKVAIISLLSRRDKRPESCHGKIIKIAPRLTWNPEALKS